MNDKAILSADYYNFEYKKGLKVCRLTFEVPYEHAGRVRDVLGDPPLGGTQVRVAIARLSDNADGSDISSDVSRPTESPLGGPDSLPQAGPRHNQGSVDRERTPFAQMACSQQAALKCGDNAFQAWLAVTYKSDTLEVATTLPASANFETISVCTLKKVLGISSRRELDTNPEKAKAWSEMLASYEYRGMAR